MWGGIWGWFCFEIFGFVGGLSDEEVKELGDVGEVLFMVFMICDDFCDFIDDIFNGVFILVLLFFFVGFF